MKRSIKYMILSLFAFLVFLSGMILLTHDFDENTNDIQQEESSEAHGAIAANIYSTIGGTKTKVGSMATNRESTNGTTKQDSFTITMEEGYYLKNFNFKFKFAGVQKFKILTTVSNTNYSFEIRLYDSTLGYTNYTASNNNDRHIMPAEDDEKENNTYNYYRTDGVVSQSISLNENNQLVYYFLYQRDYSNLFAWDNANNEVGFTSTEYTGTFGSAIDGIVYKVNLDKPNGSGGTSAIYEKYNTGYYTNSNATTQMTTSAYGITLPTRTGYTFSGYYTETNGDGIQYINASGKLTSNASATKFTAAGNLYAKWTENTYNVSYDLNRGTASTIPSHGTNHPTSATYDTAFIINNPTKSGYTFDGWTFNGDTTTAKYGSTSSTNLSWDNTSTKVKSIYFKNLTSTNGGTVTLTAQWTAKKYNLTLNANGGNVSPSSTTATYDNTYGSPFGGNIPTPTRTGYTFGGWYKESGFTNKIGDSTKYTTASDSTIYAKWIENTYTISYNLDGGTPGSNQPASATYDTTLTISNPSKTGYTFKGWYITGMDSGVTHTYGSETTTNTSISQTTATSFKNLRSTSGTVTFTAQWTPAIYTITLNNQSATIAGSTAIYEKYNTGYYTNSSATTQMTTSSNPITIPTKTGYIFDGYYTSTNGAGTQYLNKNGYLTNTAQNNHFSSSTNTLYANWLETWAQYATTTAPTLSGGYYQIKDAAQLAWFMYQVNSNSGTEIHAKQTANIDLSAHYWYPIGTSGNEFAGVYDGQGYQITGLNTHGSVSGLFGYTSGTIKNVYLSGATISGSTAGGIVGNMSGGNVENNIVYNSTISGGTTGGIVGKATGGTIKTCIYYKATSISLSGNICGSGGAITDCLSKINNTETDYSITSNNWKTVSGMFVSKLPKTSFFWIVNW